jgi:hypothetical protein
VSSTRWRAVSQLPLGQPRVGTGQGAWEGHQVGAAAHLLEALLGVVDLGVEDGVVAAAFVQRDPGLVAEVGAVGGVVDAVPRRGLPSDVHRLLPPDVAREDDGS